jgi:hypothetical protein
MTELKEGERPTITLGIISGISTGRNPGISKGIIQTPKASKHLYEVDVIRAVTALCVIGVHVLAFALLGTTGPTGEFLRYDVKSSLHFTREIFLSISAFVLVMVYGRRTLSAKTFWKKRGRGPTVCTCLQYAGQVAFCWTWSPASRHTSSTSFFSLWSST